MPFFERSDGEQLRNLSTLRRFMPYLMPRRNDAVVYFEQTIDVTDTLAYVEAQSRQGVTINFFQVVLAAMLRAEALRPSMNRFVVGKRIYQGKELAISFAVKKKLTDDARMTAVKVVFHRSDTIFDVAKRVQSVVEQGRKEALSSSEKEMKLTMFLPGFLIPFIFGLQRILDRLHLLPKSMIKNDPLYASLFVANLGSVGLDAPFHHLYEYGTIPIFATLGRIKKIPMVMPTGQIEARDAVTLRYSFDERITDGLYCAKSLQLFEEFLKNPTTLESPLVFSPEAQVAGGPVLTNAVTSRQGSTLT